MGPFTSLNTSVSNRSSFSSDYQIIKVRDDAMMCPLLHIPAEILPPSLLIESGFLPRSSVPPPADVYFLMKTYTRIPNTKSRWSSYACADLICILSTSLSNGVHSIVTFSTPAPICSSPNSNTVAAELGSH